MVIAVIASHKNPERLDEFMDRNSETLGVGVEVVLSEDAPTFELSCLRAHMKAWRLGGPITVFEDDAIFADDFTLDITPPEDWEIAWLGGEHVSPPIPYDETWYIPTKLLRTHAYMLKNPEMISAEMARIAAHRIDPDLSLLRVSQYALRRWIVGQQAGPTSRGPIRPAPEFWQWEEDNAEAN